MRRPGTGGRRGWIRFALVAALVGAGLVFRPAAAASQQEAGVRGTVVDTSDSPLSGVLVELWDDGSLLASRVTDGDGRFAFPPALSVDASLIRASRIGYGVHEEPVTGPDDTFRILLEEEPIAIRGLVVESEPRACRIDDEDRARDLWNTMRRKYVGPLDTVGISTYLAEEVAQVGRDEIGPLELPEERVDQRGSSSQLRFSWTRRARRSGYAFPVRRTEHGQSFDSWSYAPLEADFAPHFVDPVFGDLHRFRVSDEGSFGWILEFCPDDQDRPSIRGDMRLASDTSLVQVEWLFDTPEPDESAGGRAIFPPVRRQQRFSYPLPSESIVWRQIPGGEFQQVHQRYEAWVVAQGDTVPFLSPR